MNKTKQGAEKLRRPFLVIPEKYLLGPATGDLFLTIESIVNSVIASITK